MALLLLGLNKEWAGEELQSPVKKAVCYKNYAKASDFSAAGLTHLEFNCMICQPLLGRNFELLLFGVNPGCFLPLKEEMCPV